MDKTELENYIKEHSMRQTAEYFGYSPSKIRYWMKKFNIKNPEDWPCGYARTYDEQDKLKLREAMLTSKNHIKFLEDLRETNRLKKEQKYNEVKICKKCGKEFKMTKGLIDFCSIKCRNTRDLTDEIKKKISESVKDSEKYKEGNAKNIEKRRTKMMENVKLKEIDCKAYNKKKKTEKGQRTMTQNFDDLGIDSKRIRVLHEQNYKCHKCGLDKWFDEPIALEIEHINRDHSNNKRENLIALCPNCHSLTTTWRGRNKKGERKATISDEAILEALIKFDFNTRQALLNLGMAAKGGNYPRCHRIKEIYLKMLEDKKS